VNLKFVIMALVWILIPKVDIVVGAEVASNCEKYVINGDKVEDCGNVITVQGSGTFDQTAWDKRMNRQREIVAGQISRQHELNVEKIRANAIIRAAEIQAEVIANENTFRIPSIGGDFFGLIPQADDDILYLDESSVNVTTSGGSSEASNTAQSSLIATTTSSV